MLLSLLSAPEAKAANACYDFFDGSTVNTESLRQVLQKTYLRGTISEAIVAQVLKNFNDQNEDHMFALQEALDIVTPWLNKFRTRFGAMRSTEEFAQLLLDRMLENNLSSQQIMNWRRAMSYFHLRDTSRVEDFRAGGLGLTRASNLADGETLPTAFLRVHDAHVRRTVLSGPVRTLFGRPVTDTGG